MEGGRKEGRQGYKMEEGRKEDRVIRWKEEGRKNRRWLEKGIRPLNVHGFADRRTFPDGQRF